MGDEFIKGFGILTSAGLMWLIISAWFYTEGFEETQLIGPGPDSIGIYSTILVGLRDVFFWFAILGALTFWVVIPAARQGWHAYEERRQNAE